VSSARPRYVSEVATAAAVSLSAFASLADAAEKMAAAGVADVIVYDADTVRGVVTDWDIIVRAIVERRNPTKTRLGEICPRHQLTIDCSATVTEAIALLHARSTRRAPVIENGRPTGIVTAAALAHARSIPADGEDSSVRAPTALP